jgi:hypothetical protein
MSGLDRSAESGARAGSVVGDALVRGTRGPEPTGGRNSLSWRLWAEGAPMSDNVEIRTKPETPTWMDYVLDRAGPLK